MTQLPLPADIIFDAIPVGILCLEHSTIKFANKEAQRLFDSAQLINSTITDYIPEYEDFLWLTRTLTSTPYPVLVCKRPLTINHHIVIIRYAALDHDMMYEQVYRSLLRHVQELKALVTQLHLDTIHTYDETNHRYLTPERTVDYTLKKMHGFLRFHTLITGHYQSEPFELEEWITEFLTEKHKSAYAGSKQIIHQDIQIDSTVEFITIPKGIQAIIQILLSNVLQHSTRCDEIKIEVSLKAETCRLAITDQIPLRNLDWWHNYYKHENYTSSKEYHTADLDLHFVETWVNMLGGRLSLKPDPGKGATFIVELPNLANQSHAPQTLEAWLEKMPISIGIRGETQQWANRSGRAFEASEKVLEDWHSQQDKKPQITDQQLYRRFHLDKAYFDIQVTSEYFMHIGISSFILDARARNFIEMGLLGRIKQIPVILSILQAHSTYLEPYASIVADIAAQVEATEYLYFRYSSLAYDQLYIDKDSRSNLCYTLADLIKELTCRQKTLYEKRAIELKMDGLEVARDLTVQEKQFHQIITSLLSNALQATPDGCSISIYIREASNGIECLIQDQGKGIPEADLPHIYDILWRNSENYTRPPDRYQLGMGLAFCKMIVEKAGGTIEHVSSSEGTTCRMWLPFAEQH